VGGYGATGRAVVSELWKSSQCELLIGGRDLAMGNAFATQFDNRVSAARLDVLDGPALDGFCQQCSIIVNCAGPVAVLQDRVAQASLRNGCHYVDAAGLSLVKERVILHSQEIVESGLPFVVSAGWMPGITELVPAYAGKLARTKMEAIDSVIACFADSGEWSNNALRDAAWFVHRCGLRSPGYLHKGEWTRASMGVAFRKIDLGNPVGRRRFGLVSMVPEMNEVGQSFKDGDFFSYAYLSGLQTAMATTAMALFPLPERVGVRLLRNAFRRNRLPVDGFAWAQAVGHSRGDRLSLTVQIVYRERRDYWIHGLALATAARMISESRGVRSGVHFLADAVDPVTFMAELRKGGVEQTEKFETVN
jgi:saccharopine dehydrogenase (NAD+, L-lysine-forming)